MYGDNVFDAINNANERGYYLYRQNCIFLPEIFPMREAREKGGLVPEGEALMVYRPRANTGGDNFEHAPEVELDGPEAVFANWKDDDPLPSYLDDITGHTGFTIRRHNAGTWREASRLANALSVKSIVRAPVDCSSADARELSNLMMRLLQ